MSDVDGSTLLAIYEKADLIKQTDERIRGLLGSGAPTISYRGAHDQLAKEYLYKAGDIEPLDTRG